MQKQQIMRTHFPLMLKIAMLLILFSACKKEAQEIPNQNLTQLPAEDEVSLSKEGSVFKLTPRPGLRGGRDANVLYFECHPNQMDANFNYQNELDTVAWTDGGYNVIRRSLMRFDSLA